MAFVCLVVLGDAYVDPEFGTGALKVTPSHDPNDYAIGKRHDLQFINIFNKDATINGAGGAYAGLDRYVCRAKIWRDLQLAGQAIEEKVHSMRVPRSQRGGEPIEFMVSDQWFVRTEKMAQQALELSRSKALRIEPARFEPVWEDWLTNIKDWCVSRQLWWGHRIPVYYVENSPSEFIVVMPVFLLIICLLLYLPNCRWCPGPVSG